MTVHQIQNSLKEVSSRVSDTERRLAREHDLDRGLELQRTLSNLRGYEARLRSQLDKVIERESRDREKREHAALDSELAALTAQANDLKGEMSALLRNPNLGLEQIYQGLVPLHDELIALDVQHEAGHYRRYNLYPTEGLVRSRVQVVPPNVAPDDDIGQIIAFAVELLHHQRTGHGYKLLDVYQALGHMSVNFGVY